MLPPLDSIYRFSVFFCVPQRNRAGGLPPGLGLLGRALCSGVPAAHHLPDQAALHEKFHLVFWLFRAPAGKHSAEDILHTAQDIGEVAECVVGIIILHALPVGASQHHHVCAVQPGGEFHQDRVADQIGHFKTHVDVDGMGVEKGQQLCLLLLQMRPEDAGQRGFCNGGNGNA